MLLFSKSFSVSILFSLSIENHPFYPNKEKTYKLFVYSCNIPPVIDPNEHINSIYFLLCILTPYMLDSALEPSYYLSKNLLLLPWILKLIVDVVNDSTPPMLKMLILFTSISPDLCVTPERPNIFIHDR